MMQRKSHENIALAKKLLRNILLKKLKSQGKREKQRKSKRILKKLFKTKEFIEAKRIMFYLAMSEEVQTQKMIDEAEKLGKEIFVPICDAKNRRRTPTRPNA